jgi:hypothetical protein
MEVITDHPTTWLCSHVVLSRFYFLFCFVLFHTAFMPRRTLDTSFSRSLYVIPFFFLFFFILLSLVFFLPPVDFDLLGCGNCGCTTTQTQTPFHSLLDFWCNCTVLYSVN